MGQFKNNPMRTKQTEKKKKELESIHNYTKAGTPKQGGVL